MSLGFGSAVCGHLLGGLLADRLGRRGGALAVCPVFMAGFLCRGLGDRWGQALLP